MDYVYPAVFYLEDNARYSVIFPDLNDLATQGDDLADAINMAKDACSLYLFTALRDGEPLPEPTPISEVKPDDDTGFVNLILVDLNEYAKKYGDKAVKKTLNIPAWLNTVCEEQNINFSKVLQEALLSKIQSK